MINGRDYLLQETKMDDIRCLIWQAVMHLNKAQAFPVVCNRSANNKVWSCGEIYYNVSDTDQVASLFCFALLRSCGCVLVFYAHIWT